MDESLETILELGVAVAAGLLIGLEREASEGLASDEAKEGAHPAIMGGVRTHPLFSLGGAIAVLLAGTVGPWIVAAVFAGFAAFALIGYAHDRRIGGSRGITTEVALLISFLLGALTPAHGLLEPTTHRLTLVASVATIVALLLSLKQKLHGWVHRISSDDLAATLKFLIVGVVFLPLLPDRTYGPLAVLNPFKIGWMVALIAGLGFVGYVATRALGPDRGIGLTGFIGGLASSTAVTLTFSARARQTPELGRLFALAVVLASTIMFLRVSVVVAVLEMAVLQRVIVPLAGMALAGGVAGAILYRRSLQPGARAGVVEMANPFDLSMALKFGAVYALVLLGSKAATIYLGRTGVYLTGVLVGALQVDAITLSMTDLARGGFDADIAATTIVLGAAANTVAKAVLAAALGRGTFGRQVAVSLGFVAAVGVLLAALP